MYFLTKRIDNFDDSIAALFNFCVLKKQRFYFIKIYTPQYFIDFQCFITQFRVNVWI